MRSWESLINGTNLKNQLNQLKDKYTIDTIIELVINECARGINGATCDSKKILALFEGFDVRQDATEEEKLIKNILS